jgi:hypothetical protein
MSNRNMDFFNIWLPLIGGGILFAIAIGAWFSEHKITAIWFGFSGAICFLLLAALQLQDYEINTASHPDESNEITKRQLRAYVLVVAADFRNFGTKQPIIVTGAIKNTGQTPATQLRVRIEGFCGIPFPMTQFPTLETKFGGPTTLGAGDTHLLGPASLTAILSPEIEAEIIAGRAAIYLYGEIAYFDVFKVEHLTKFRLFYRGNGSAISSDPIPFVTAPEGNDSD